MDKTDEKILEALNGATDSEISGTEGKNHTLPKRRMYVKGLKFGMLLQLSVGPVCLFVFKTAGEGGFPAGLAAAAAVTLVDALYILLAGTGAAVFLKREKVRRFVKAFGSAVLVVFGAVTVLGAFDIVLPSGPALLPAGEAGGPFLRGILLTASNPLTIVFWSGAFSAEASAHRLDKSRLASYGLGCLSATAVFLPAVAGLGCLAGSFLPAGITMALSGLVGLLLIVFGVRLALKKTG